MSESKFLAVIGHIFRRRSSLTPVPPMPAAALQEKIAPPPAAVEETPVNAALSRLSRSHMLQFNRVEGGYVFFIGNGLEVVDGHEFAPLESSRLPALQSIFEEDRNIFAELRAHGEREVPIPGYIRFQNLDLSFIEPRETRPSDRLSVAGGLGGKEVFWAVKEKVDLDTVIGKYDDMIGECQKAFRASMALSHQLATLLEVKTAG